MSETNDGVKAMSYQLGQHRDEMLKFVRSHILRLRAVRMAAKTDLERTEATVLIEKLETFLKDMGEEVDA